MFYNFFFLHFINSGKHLNVWGVLTQIVLLISNVPMDEKDRNGKRGLEWVRMEYQ